MADKSFYAMESRRHNTKVVTVKVVTAGTSAPTFSVDDSDVSATARNGLGDYDITLKDTYRQLLAASQPSVIGTAGNRCDLHSVDVTTGAINIQLATNAEAAADSTGETISFMLLVRNSSVGV